MERRGEGKEGLRGSISMVYIEYRVASLCTYVLMH